MFTASAELHVPVNGLAISLCAPEEAQRANALEEMLNMKLNGKPNRQVYESLR